MKVCGCDEFDKFQIHHRDLRSLPNIEAAAKQLNVLSYNKKGITIPHYEAIFLMQLLQIWQYSLY